MKVFNSKVSLSDILWSIVALYFVYHSFTGGRGLISWLKTTKEYEKLSRELSELKSQNAMLQNKISRLKVNNLDIDLLEEEAMSLLGVADQDDIIVMLPTKK